MVTPLYTVDIVWLVHRRQLETFILVSLSAKFFCWGKLLFVDAMVSEWFDFCFACDKTDAEKILNW